MYETHKSGFGDKEGYASQANAPPESNLTYHTSENTWGGNDRSWNEGEWDSKYEETSEIILEDGSIMLAKPQNRPNRGIHLGLTNHPGAERRGTSATFQIEKEKGRGISMPTMRGPPLIIGGTARATAAKDWGRDSNREKKGGRSIWLTPFPNLEAVARQPTQRKQQRGK